MMFGLVFVLVWLSQPIAGADKRPGIVLWKFQSPERGDLSSPSIGSDGTIYLGSGDKRVYALEGKTGVKKWEFETGRFVNSSPAIGVDGNVYVGSEAGHRGKVYTLDGKTGTEKGEFKLGDKICRPLTLGVDGTVYVISPNNELYALNGELDRGEEYQRRQSSAKRLAERIKMSHESKVAKHAHEIRKLMEQGKWGPMKEDQVQAWAARRVEWDKHFAQQRVGREINHRAALSLKERQDKELRDRRESKLRDAQWKRDIADRNFQSYLRALEYQRSVSARPINVGTKSGWAFGRKGILRPTTPSGSIDYSKRGLPLSLP